MFGLRIDKTVYARFRSIAKSEKRNLNDQFTIILDEWIAFKSGKGRLPRLSQTGIEVARVGGIEELESEVLEEMDEKADTSKSDVRRRPK